MNFEVMMDRFRALAIDAGAAILEIYHRDELDVRSKEDLSPVTEADEAADKIIREGLAADFPEILIVTEEFSDSQKLSADTFIIVDPLDGTKEFIKKGTDFTVNIALVQNGVPTHGVVYAPAQKRLFMTGSESGAYEEIGTLDPRSAGEMKQISVAQTDGRKLMVVASKSHRDAATDDYIGKYDVADFTSAGSSLKFCLVATGEAHLYPRLGPTMEWDTAAGDAVLRGAGGKVVDFDTHEDFRYGKAEYRNGFFIAAAPGVTLIGADE